MKSIRVSLFFSIIIATFLLAASIFILLSSIFKSSVGNVADKNQKTSQVGDSSQASQKDIFEKIKDGIDEGEGIILLESARKVSIKTDVITLSGCNPDILIAQAPLNGTINIKNSDTNAHTFRISRRKFELKAGGVQAIKTDFEKGSGMYSYFCDDSKTPSGILVVLAKTSQ